MSQCPGSRIRRTNVLIKNHVYLFTNQLCNSMLIWEFLPHTVLWHHPDYQKDGFCGIVTFGRIFFILTKLTIVVKICTVVLDDFRQVSWNIAIRTLFPIKTNLSLFQIWNIIARENVKDFQRFIKERLFFLKILKRGWSPYSKYSWFYWNVEFHGSEILS